MARCDGRVLLFIDRPQAYRGAMADADTLRRLALALPEAIEQDHHGRPSFRVAGRVFATSWEPERASLMLDEGGILSAVQCHPKACAKFYWGRRLRAVQITLRLVSGDALVELLSDA